jgi:hypothetical protein
MTTKLQAWVTDRKWIFCLLAVLLLLRVAFLHFFPVALWNSSDDYPVMSLAHGIYLDERLATDAQKHVGYAQVAHPGIPFQIMSWVAYRISDIQFVGDFESRVRAVLSDSSRFFLALKIIPLIIFSLIFLPIWGRIVRALPLFYALSLPLIYFSIGPAFTYGFMYLGNDTFALPLGVALLLVLTKANQVQGRQSIKWWVLAGMIGGLSYLNKLNYVMWSAGIVFGYVFACLYLRTRILERIANIAAFFIGFGIAIQIIGCLYLGKAGVQSMLTKHGQYVTHSGLYGTGESTYVSLVEVLKNISGSISGYPFFWMLFSVILFQACWILANRRKADRSWLETNLPLIGSFAGAALMVILAALKHYGPHYLIPLAAIMVCIAWWSGTQATSRYQQMFIIPFVMLAFVSAFKDVVSFESIEQSRIISTQKEIAQIHALPLPAGKTRLWTYHVSSKEYMQYFLSLLVESPKLNVLLDESNPKDKHLDIFGEYVDKALDEMNWKYAIFQNIYFGTPDKLPEYFTTHGKILKKFDHLLVVEHVEPGQGQ